MAYQHGPLAGFSVPRHEKKRIMSKKMFVGGLSWNTDDASLRQAFEAFGEEPLEAAATLRASPLDRFFTVALPLARPGILTGAILGFAHTVGEFGVVLMIGGNIPGETKVLSVAIYDYVETLQWGKAHVLAGGMVVFSFIVILSMMLIERRLRNRLT